MKQMRDNSQSSFLKSFNGYNTVLARINEYNQQQKNVEYFSYREEQNALEMTNVVKSVTSFLNAHNDRCYKLELIPNVYFYKLLWGLL